MHVFYRGKHVYNINYAAIDFCGRIDMVHVEISRHGRTDGWTAVPRNASRCLMLAVEAD